MKIVKIHDFGPVKGIELGYGMIGPPLMTVYCYLVDGVLIDSGQSRMKKHFEDLIENYEIRTLLLTHHHEDHSGNAVIVKKMKNADVYGHSLTVKKMSEGFNILPYQHLLWGKSYKVEMAEYPDKVKTKNYEIIPISTPGHSKDHSSFFVKSEGWIFSGDLYLGPKIKFFRSDENIVDTIVSIKKVISLDFDAIFCSHNPQVAGGKKQLYLKLNYLEEIYGNVKMLYEKGCKPGEILTRLGKEKLFIKLFTCCNVSFKNIILSTISSLGEVN